LPSNCHGTDPQKNSNSYSATSWALIAA
jgi:hypothetical protein